MTPFNFCDFKYQILELETSNFSDTSVIGQSWMCFLVLQYLSVHAWAQNNYVAKVI